MHGTAYLPTMRHCVLLTLVEPAHSTSQLGIELVMGMEIYDRVCYSRLAPFLSHGERGARMRPLASPAGEPL